MVPLKTEGRWIGVVHPAYSFVLLLAGLIFVALSGVSAGCYFPEELQGGYVMQSTVTAGTQVQYSALNISAISIPIWGLCHRRIGSNVLLMDYSGGATCIRCFHLILRSKNVLSVSTEGLDKCYTSEEAAVATCPGESPGIGRQSIASSPHTSSTSLDRHSQEIILFRTSGVSGEQVHSEFCPWDGRFTFTYSTNEGGVGRSGCQGQESEMENCPAGSGLHFHFRGCSFPDRDLTFQCLGHWPGPNKQQYIALLETSTAGKPRARYRCALYREDSATGVISMAFSSDSTCSSDLRSATDGFELMTLLPHVTFHWPQALDPSPCRFPSWAQGCWEHLVVESNTLVFKDHRTFTTYTFRCLTSENGADARFLIFGRTQCGEEMYTCVWMKKRGLNVLEFQLGLRSSTIANGSLCMDTNFRDDTWITQGRVDVFVESPCPIAGEYTGIIPDNSIFCAKLYSDCTRPEIMFYTVSDCKPEPEVYEEREYKCLGQWEEDGVLYTYTQRRDLGSYECFVGSIVSSHEIYIQEAGEHCQRTLNPLQKGMKLTKKGSCQSLQENNGPSTYSTSLPHPTISWYSSKKPQETTKPWKPITGSPKGQSGIQNAVHKHVVDIYSFISILSLVFIL